MGRATTDHIESLSASEREHLRLRERKRRTRMVVDNAGLKRVLLDRARRARERAAGHAERDRS